MEKRTRTANAPPGAAALVHLAPATRTPGATLSNPKRAMQTPPSLRERSAQQQVQVSPLVLLLLLYGCLAAVAEAQIPIIPPVSQPGQCSDFNDTFVFGGETLAYDACLGFPNGHYLAYNLSEDSASIMLMMQPQSTYGWTAWGVSPLGMPCAFPPPFPVLPAR